MNLLLFIGFFFLCLSLNAQPPGISYTYEYPYKDGIPIKRHQERRLTLRNTHGNRSLIVSLSADTRNRQNDVDHPYRQNSNFLYLTGMPYAKSALIIAPGGIEHEGKVSHEFFFLQPRNTEKEAWEGAMMGLEEAKMLMIDRILPYTELRSFLIKHLNGIDTVFFTGLPTANVPIPLAEKPLSVEKALKDDLQSTFPELYVKTTMPSLNAMREIKDSDELRLMKKAIEISIEGHTLAMKECYPGITEYELEALMEFAFKKGGAEDIGYSSIMGSGYNACILHYTFNRKATLHGDLVLADCGAEFQNYTADITRTFPVNGTFTQDQKTLYDFVLEAADSAIAEAKVGNAFRAPHNAAKRVLLKKLMGLGIIEKEEELKWYFMHGTSHYLGLDVHDPGTMGTLKDGSIITVEPGIYIPPGSPCDKRWWNIGIRIEDDILITQDGPVNLSATLPRTTNAIENLMKAKNK
ncbi:Xaa-Pro aminopeptidase [Chlorobiota bacterium]|nr:Xaa-Pro aminopeptidase [Chlorobiota bacterium]